METPETCSDGSELSPKKPAVPRKKTLPSPELPSSKSFSVNPSPERVLADGPVKDHAPPTDKSSTSQKQRGPSPVLRYNSAEKHVDQLDDRPAAGTSCGASTLASTPEWAGTDAVLMDEKAAGSERLGKPFSSSGARRRRRRSRHRHTDATNDLTTRRFERRHWGFLFGFAVIVLTSGFLVGAMWNILSLGRAGGDNEPTPCYGADCATGDIPFGNFSGRNIDPCDDFRSYVCSWWKPLDRFPELTISAQSDLVVKWIEGFGSMLETGAAVDKSGVGQKVSQFYHSCMTRTERTQGDADAFVGFIRTLGLTWPEMPPSGVRAMGTVLELNYRLAMPLWFSLSAVRNEAQSGRRRLVLKPCCLGRLRFVQWRNQQAVDRGLYYDYWVAHYEALLGRKSVSRDRNEVNDLAREEAHIVEKLAKLSEVYPSVPLLFRFADIGSHTKRISSNDWLTQVNKYIVGDGGGHAFTPEDELLVSDESVLFAIDSLLGWYTPEKLIDHLSWQFVQMHAWIVDSTLLEIWGQNYWQIYEPILCARETEVVYRPVVAALYVGQTATPQERSQLDANLTDLRDFIAKMYASSTWIDQASRNVAIEKLRAMSVGLWPSESFFDHSKLQTMYAKFLNKNVTAHSWVRLWISAQETMRSLSGTSLHDVTMNMRSALFPFLFDYDYLTNKVDVAVSALAKPLYCAQWTPEMFYGSMAFAFALSMMKMQDLTGLKLYGNGTLVQAGRWSWLSDGTAKAYRQKAECLAEEPIGLSDIAAFEVVYAALSRGMSNSTSLLQISREIDEKRTFFMAICLHSCSVENRRSPTADCNALMRHSRDFSEVFHCKVGSRMNPFIKCSYF
ncbi:uncharacterized protein LOC119391212 [Rhipicephalus sanguineus]|uniref:Peptidase M13 N-terminal domain-containing protein n=1 Tax=Rhipicephalus sanguineus TaxID=34632 RepID=A0A9D4SZ10_RHISA|nr:uncharacterized protein LOC119391212 [Rhipicephalus sanguineus]KAH7957545.1 hypothetical protein HPB52_020038 [Rhipicephalus sanguineus]